MRRWISRLLTPDVVIVAVACALLGPSAGRGADATAPAANPALQAALADYQQGNWQDAWFRLWGLAQRGDAAAQFDLAQLYRLGKGIPEDLQLAFGWYQKAAAQGHGFAQYNLGAMYELGQGTPRDLVRAHDWYARAAAQDIAGSQAALDRLGRPGPSSGGRASP